VAKQRDTDDDDDVDDDESGAEDSKKKAKKVKGPKRLGPRTVAKPCLIGAALLALLANVLPH
jgi:hypothetical protein